MNIKKIKSTLIKDLVTHERAFAVVVSVAIISTFVLVSSGVMFAEQQGSTPDSGVSSRISSLNTNLVNLGYGSESATPDWGSVWNRIKTAASWVPDGNAVNSDVAVGKTYYNSSRTLETGIYPAPGACASQLYTDGDTASIATDNCSYDWQSVSDLVGADKKDPRTGLVWSNYVIWNGNKFDFSSTPSSQHMFINSGGDGVRGIMANFCNGGVSGWRVPTEKELLQAYVDGAFYNLTDTTGLANDYWTPFQEDINLSTGAVISNTDWRWALYVRCVQ